MESILFPINKQRVPCICTSVEPSTNLYILRKDVDQFAISLVSPLGTKNYTKW